MHRSLPVAVALVVLVVGLVGACAPSGRGHSLLGDPTPIGGQAPSTAPPPSAYVPPTTAPSTVAPSTTAAPTTTTTAAPAAARPYPVGWTLLELTDPSRPTAFTPGRHLPTYVFYPAVGPAGGAETAGAPGLGQPSPLVIFAGGYNTSFAIYHDIVHHLAEAGFVVAMPLFPLATAGGPLNENDLVSEPGDITFVANQVIAAGGLLKGLADPSHIALIGHSDGGEAVLGAAYLPGQLDARARVVIAGAAAGVLLGNHGSSDVAHDVMVIQGTADTINPPSYGDRLYATTGSPKAYLQLIGAPHLEPWSTANQWHGVVEAAIVDWLDAWFPNQYSASAAARLGHDANVQGTSVIRLG
ncbi:MAG TPA: hypothetical protein VFA84_02210 [Acidimicrobiales bacterium]|nr:hypothetical protein [Acidimicrobiales bacterium]